MGVGPIETIHGPWKQRGLEEMLHTTSIHFDKGFELNGFAWVTNIWEVVIGPEGLADWLSAVRQRWPAHPLHSARRVRSSLAPAIPRITRASIIALSSRVPASAGPTRIKRSAGL